MTVPIQQATGTGSSADIQGRIWGIIPKRWFSWKPPNYSAIVGGLSDLSSWCYALVGYARAQTRLATAYGVWLDILAYDFLQLFLVRAGASDDAWRALIKATILQERVTRKGMINAVTQVTAGIVPWVFEPWNTGDTGAYSSSSKTGFKCGQFGYGVGVGGYGNMNLPNQVFMKVWRGLPSGVPGVGGYGNNIDGYGVGAAEYVGSEIPLQGTSNQVIDTAIGITKPTATLCWVQIGPPLLGTKGYGMPKRPAIMNSKNNSQNIAII